MDFLEAIESYGKFDRDKTYVLCCEVGLKSAHLAEVMHEDGYDVFNLRGGLRRMAREAVPHPAS